MGYDYVCFSFDVGQPWREFAEAAASKSIPIVTCGVGNSCCSVGSDLGGIVGLVKDGAIQCVELKGTIVLPEPHRPICARPSELVVKRETLAEPRQRIPGRAGTPQPGKPYYKVMERPQ
jgi:hypothetical protein